MPTQNDPIPAGAVETAARALCIRVLDFSVCQGHGFFTRGEQYCERGYTTAEAVLTAAAPLIAAQATAELEESRDWWKSTCEFWHETATEAWSQRDSAAFSVKQLERELTDLQAENERLRAVAEAARALTGDPDDPAWRTLSAALDALLPEQAIGSEAEEEH